MAKGGKREGAGRKKGFAALEAEKARELIAKKLSTQFGPIVEKAIEQAIDGDKYAREWLSDRAYGKALQSLELTGKDGKDLIPVENEMKKKSDAMIAKYLHDHKGNTE